MIRFRHVALALVVNLAAAGLAAAQCSFSTAYRSPDGLSKSYPLEDVRAFVVTEIRPRLSQLERRDSIEIVRSCNGLVQTAVMQIQTDDFYLTNVMNHEVLEDVYRYDEQNLTIDHAAFNKAFEDALGFPNLSKDRQRDVLKVFAYVFAESARFSVIEERLDDLFKKGCRVNWAESKTLFRRWGKMSGFARAAGINDHTHVGGKNMTLLAPISVNVATRYGDEAFNGNSGSDLDKTIDVRDFKRRIEWDSPACGDSALTIREERDHIMMLLAFSVVLNDWQTDVPSRRGHNIGSVLVDQHGQPVFWARNANKVKGDATQHGEVRLIQNYLNCKGVGDYADRLTVYTSLEPCAMCSGMMTLTQVERVVYGQSDPGYGKAVKALLSVNYPDVYEDVPLDISPIKRALDAAYRAKKQTITGFLLTPEAKAIYERASSDLDAYSPTYSQNVAPLASARAMKSKALKEDPQLGLAANCPIQ